MSSKTLCKRLPIVWRWPRMKAPQQMILGEIGQALRKTQEKRDTVVAFLRHCELQLKFADAEIEHMERRKAFTARVEE
jgi:hypothetical protein